MLVVGFICCYVIFCDMLLGAVQGLKFLEILKYWPTIYGIKNQQYWVISCKYHTDDIRNINNIERIVLAISELSVILELSAISNHNLCYVAYAVSLNLITFMQYISILSDI